MKKILLSHSGKQHSYHVALALHKAGRLDKFVTSGYLANENLQKYLLAKGNNFWTRRFISGLPANKVEPNWHFEAKEMILRRIYGKTDKAQRAVYARDVGFDTYLSKRMNRYKDSDIFWGFQGSCLKSLQAAAQLGKYTICELATAHAPSAIKILGYEASLHPEWADSIDNLIFPDEYLQRISREPHIADHVLAASGFTRQSLLDDGVMSNKISVLPLGFQMDHISYKPKIFKPNQTIKVLFAGTITQRKGIKYLLDAWKKLGLSGAELHLIGGIQGSGSALKAYQSEFVYHSPMAQQQLFETYNQYDLLVLPSIFEGFGLVIVEALAAGLPVISTSHSMAPEVLEQGKSGYIVPIRDTDALAAALQTYIELDADAKTQMSAEARKQAIAFSWNAYQDRLGNMPFL